MALKAQHTAITVVASVVGGGLGALVGVFTSPGALLLGAGGAGAGVLWGRSRPQTAGRWFAGAKGEEATAALIDPLTEEGWYVFHNRRLGKKWDVDHVLVPPCGTGLVVLNSKWWKRKCLTVVDGNGRLRCGEDDRTYAVDGVVREAAQAIKIVSKTRPRWKGLAVVPALVIHNSPLFRGRELVASRHWNKLIHVYGPDTLVDALRTIPGDPRPKVAHALAVRTHELLPPME
ncbi:nuclease-related domain-containing protein [Streptomyces ipomoeae]|uniref:nuclease-related domain-containing protein n=1 Tax=Streptomyces ipomoeae TaxID=103232 RepID=UPI0015F08E2E|nr:nuclease-related domain-containing protein [Streptomyces ipomoeae]